MKRQRTMLGARGTADPHGKENEAVLHQTAVPSSRLPGSVAFSVSGLIVENKMLMQFAPPSVMNRVFGPNQATGAMAGPTGSFPYASSLPRLGQGSGQRPRDVTARGNLLSQHQKPNRPDLGGSALRAPGAVPDMTTAHQRGSVAYLAPHHIPLHLLPPSVLRQRRQDEAGSLWQNHPGEEEGGGWAAFLEPSSEQIPVVPNPTTVRQARSSGQRAVSLAAAHVHQQSPEATMHSSGRAGSVAASNDLMDVDDIQLPI